jgi:hypothetical protein
MVRALLEGRKFQTRRPLKQYEPKPGEKRTPRDLFRPQDKRGPAMNLYHSPRIKAGDRLYVREHWCVDRANDNMPPRDMEPGIRPLWYLGGYLMYTGSQRLWTDKSGADFDASACRGRHRQAMHMPRWASRITLDVTEVRVERLDDISEADARAEGIEQYGRFFGLPDTEWDDSELTAKGAFRHLWETINGPDSWDETPWVIVNTFKVTPLNVDRIAA